MCFEEEKADVTVGAANVLLLCYASLSYACLRGFEHFVTCPESVSITSRSWKCLRLSPLFHGKKEKGDLKFGV